MGESVRKWTTETDAASFPSSAAIWEEIELAERYLVCCMFEEAASLASSIVWRLRNCGLTESIESNEFVDIMESSGMVFVQSLKELGRSSELISELKELFGTVAAMPGQVFITGACMHIADGSSSSLRPTFEEFLGKWKYVGHSLLFLNKEAKCSPSRGIRWPHLSVEKYLYIVEFYAITILGMVVNDIDLAVSWTEKAGLPEERRQEILRRLHSFCSAKNSSSPVVFVTPPLADATNMLAVSGATERSMKNVKDQKHHKLDISKSGRSSSSYWSLLNHMASGFWWFHTIHLKCGNATLILPRGKIIIWSSLALLICYVLQRKRATLQRFAARQVSSLKRALIDAWQLAFSVQVNPLAAIQPVPSAPHGSR